MSGCALRDGTHTYTRARAHAHARTHTTGVRRDSAGARSSRTQSHMRVRVRHATLRTQSRVRVRVRHATLRAHPPPPPCACIGPGVAANSWSLTRERSGKSRGIQLEPNPGSCLVSPAWRFRSGSRLGRRTSRNGTLPAHDLHCMGREACCRHDMAYLVSWRRGTHLQRSLRWGNASRFESSRPAILNTAILQNRVYVRFRRLLPL